MLEFQTTTLTVDQLAQYLQVSDKVIYNLVQEGKIPHRKIGRRIIFLESEVEQWLAAS